MITKIINPKKITLFAMLGLLLGSIGLAILPQQHAFANGETYTWGDFKTLNVTGGEFHGTLSIFSSPGSPGGIMPGTENKLAGNLISNLTGNCVINANLTLSSATAGRIQGNVQAVTNGQQGGGPPCPSSLDSSTTAFQNGYNIATSNARPPNATQTDETDAQKTVNITVKSSLPADQSPDSLTFTLTTPPNTTISLTKSVSNNEATYSGAMLLDPGTYNYHLSALVPDGSFDKVKFTSKLLSLGELAREQTIGVTVNLNFLGGQPKDIPALKLVLKNADGTPAGTGTTEALKDVPPLDTGLSGGTNVQGTYTVRGAINNVAPGTYKVCVDGTTVCADVTKVANTPASAELSLQSVDTAAAVAAATGPKASETHIDCETGFGGGFDVGSIIDGAVSWIMCPVIALTWRKV